METIEGKGRQTSRRTMLIAGAAAGAAAWAAPAVTRSASAAAEASGMPSGLASLKYATSCGMFDSSQIGRAQPGSTSTITICVNALGAGHTLLLELGYDGQPPYYSGSIGSTNACTTVGIREGQTLERFYVRVSFADGTPGALTLRYDVTNAC